MDRFSKSTDAVLRKCGWSSGRSVDVSEYTRLFHGKKLHYHKSAESFLMEFDRLHISFHNGFRKIDFYIDGIEILKAFCNYHRLLDYENRIRMDATLLGEAEVTQNILIMGENGSVYEGCDDLLWLIGNNGDEALDHLISGTSAAVEVP